MKRIGIIGAGRFGQAMLESLSAKGVEVLLIDSNMELVQDYADFVTKAVAGDASNVRTLREAGFDQCDIAIVCIGENMEGSIMATVNCKDLGIPTVIAKAESDIHGKVLKRIGADIVVAPNRDRAQRLAKAILSRTPVDIFEIADGINIAEIEPPKDITGKTLVESGVRQRYGITVLAIRRPQEDPRLPRTTIIATGKETIQPNDRLIVFSDDMHLDALRPQ